MQRIERTATFLRQTKQLRRKHYDFNKLEKVIRLLMAQNNEVLRRRYRDHVLKGNLHDFRELHIEADWLLVYQIKRDVLTLVLVETGSHQQVLGK
ncbi:MAG: type II toxin-antitoxin system YafQ family toxin [Bifidobacterium sp.]|nr:type II toxin-antitoxin system YafQ family toxin [Bifidobacterium sp.]